MGVLLTERREDVLVLTINRPEVRNALNAEVRDALWAALDEAEADAALRALVLTGAGEKAFVAGADIRELKERTPVSHLAAGGRLDLRIEGLQKPVVAAVNGYALGGGCELAMACTLRVASEHARFGQPEINLGIIPGMGGTQRLSRLCGVGHALRLCLTGDIIDAQEAHRIGLANYLVPAGELLPFAVELAGKLGKKPPVALRAARDAVLRGADMGLQAGLDFETRLFALCLGTEDKAEGMSAFLEKREPRFKGR
jgi:enoyl-CoA hydratase